jgi:Ca2+-binding EF-hand superfamily protein
MATAGPSRLRTDSNKTVRDAAEDQILNTIREAFYSFDVEKSGKMPTKDLKVITILNLLLFIVFSQFNYLNLLFFGLFYLKLLY